MKHILAAIGMLLLIASAPVAHAQSARHAQLSTQLMELMFEGPIFDRMIEAMADGVRTSMSTDPHFPTEWVPLFQEAAAEEMARDRPRIVALMGADLGRNFTEAELEAGVKVMTSSGGRALFRAGVDGAATPQLTRAQERELDAIYRTKAGRSFLEKLEKLQANMFDSATREIVRELLPGIFRRFGEKAEAYEAARRPAA